MHGRFGHGHSKRPGLFKQDQGLKDYITAHEQDLRAALAKVKADAAAALEQHDAQAAKPFQASWPLSRNNWVAWLDEHHEDFMCLLKDMRAGARRQVNARVLADPSLPELGSAAPLVPKAKTARPSWARLVRSGWYALHLTETAAPVAPPPAAPAVPPQRLVLFVVSAGLTRAAWAPRAGRDRHRLWRHQPGSLAERISRVARGHAGCAGVEAIHADRRLRRRVLLRREFKAAPAASLLLRPLFIGRSSGCFFGHSSEPAPEPALRPLQRLLLRPLQPLQRLLSGRDVSSPGGRHDGWDSVFSDFVKNKENKRKKQKGTKSDS